MSDWVSNSCSGARFRTLPDFRIEVEGLGIPFFEPGSASYNQLIQTWKNWKGLIRKNAARMKIPPSYLLAVATKETGLYSADKAKQAAIASPAGAVGVMQIMPCAIFQAEPYKSLVCTRNRTNPADSFFIGATLLGEKIKKLGGLPPAASSYNAGTLKCSIGTQEANVFNWHHEHNYSLVTTKLNNSAIQYLKVNDPDYLNLFLSSALVGGGLFALYVGARNIRRLQLP